MKVRWLFATVAGIALVGFGLGRCGSEEPAPAEQGPPGESLRSSKSRLTHPQVSPEQIGTLTEGNLAFGLDFLRAARPAENFFFSPHSLSIALAMTYGGAGGSTHDQLQSALHFALADSELHGAFNALDLELASRSEVATGDGGQVFRLHIVNALFGQKGHSFLDTYLDLLAEDYGAGLSLLDFAVDPEGSRRAINGWVADQTAQRIPELIAQGVVNQATVLVLTNAVHFSASWKQPFEPAKTATAEFHRLDGTTGSAPFMHASTDRRYSAGDGFEAVELDYIGDQVCMLVVLPAQGTFASFEAGLTASQLGLIATGLGERRVELSLPKFSFRTAVPGKPILQALGMIDAFDERANFSKMDGTRDLFVQDVVHEAFVAVDEAGTEAAAATAVVVGRVSLPQPATFKADRPFLFFIRDKTTGAVIFTGRVVNLGV